MNQNNNKSFGNKGEDIASDYLKKNALIILELGFGQDKSVKKLFERRSKFNVIEVIKDYNNIDRVIVARKKG